MGQFKPMVKMETTEPSVILKLAKGGSFRASANGIAQQGKTKGTQIKMNRGGMPC